MDIPRENVLEVGIAELKVSAAPDILVARGLGSCVAIALYDPVRRIGGLAHPMLPRIGDFRGKGNPCRYADFMISLLMDELQKKGSRPESLKAKLFGGAHMFASVPVDSSFNIGARNIETAREKLDSYHIKVSAEDVGGNYGRTVFFDLTTGVSRVRTMFFGEKEL